MRTVLVAALIIAASPSWAQYQIDSGRRSPQYYERQQQQFQPNQFRGNSTYQQDNRPYYQQQPTLGDPRNYRRTDPRTCTSLLCD